MAKQYLRFQHIRFEYQTSTQPIFNDLTFHLAPGWTGVVGANGSGKSTLLKLATGFLLPSSGAIQSPEEGVYCAQRTDDCPRELPSLLESGDAQAQRLLWMLGIEDDWARRWPTLSHGERKRCQIGVALWQEPRLLAVDEPTNHLDSATQTVLMDALKTYRGVGLIVSHNRELLDTLCEHCLFIEPPDAVLRPGGVTRGMEEARRERLASRRTYQQKRQAVKKMEREAKRRRTLADASKRKSSKRGLAKKDSDARLKIDCGRITGKDAIGGRLLRQMQGRLNQARHDLTESACQREYETGIWLEAESAAKPTLFFQEETSLAMGARTLFLPTLSIGSRDRIAVSGPNGSGKSTLIREVVAGLSIPRDKLTYIPQEIDARQSADILESARKLPGHKLGFLMTVIRRLGSEPERLLESAIPSPGETRKLMLGLGMTQHPHLILMDEPTNHMDLPSITALEQALSACPCALILVSHDVRFLENLTEIRWEITADIKRNDIFLLHIK